VVKLVLPISLFRERDADIYAREADILGIEAELQVPEIQKWVVYVLYTAVYRWYTGSKTEIKISGVEKDYKQLSQFSKSRKMGCIHSIYTNIQQVYTKTEIEPRAQILLPSLYYLIVIIYCLLFINTNFRIIN